MWARSPEPTCRRPAPASARREADLADARATLAASSATYVRVIGIAPGSLIRPKPWRHIPRSLEAALAIAAETNPEVLSAFFVELASRHNIDLVTGELLPEVSLEASYTQAARAVRHDQLDRNRQWCAAWSTVPLYESGVVYSRVREAKQVASQRRHRNHLLPPHGARAGHHAWTALESVRIAIRAIADQVAANQLALDGVKQEALAGSRTTLDVLDAESDSGQFADRPGDRQARRDCGCLSAHRRPWAA